jgi:hypothetical protein
VWWRKSRFHRIIVLVMRDVEISYFN